MVVLKVELPLDAIQVALACCESASIKGSQAHQMARTLDYLRKAETVYQTLKDGERQ